MYRPTLSSPTLTITDEGEAAGGCGMHVRGCGFLRKLVVFKHDEADTK